MNVLFHVDLDAFYASVEQIDNPSLKGKPVIVGGNPSRRGVVSACSYEARRWGVHSAMPLSQALRRCPEGIFQPVRMKRYIEYSEQVMKILESYTPDFQQISIDEAFLDMTGTERLYGPPLKIGKMIKERVSRVTGLNISIGIAPNKYLAKLACEYSKPDGLYEIRPGSEIEFLDSLELKDLWGVGEKTRERLMELNISTVKRLRIFSLDILSPMLGDAAGRYLYNAVRGIDPGIHPSRPKSHSVSSERTYETDTKNFEILKTTILELSEHIMHRLLIGGFKTNTVCLKLRTYDFTTTSIQKTHRHWITSSDEIFKIAVSLLKQKWNGSTPVRLIGVGTANVVKAGEATQGELFEDTFEKKRKVEEAVTKIRERITGITLTKASLLKRKRK